MKGPTSYNQQLQRGLQFSLSGMLEQTALRLPAFTADFETAQVNSSPR